MTYAPWCAASYATPGWAAYYIEWGNEEIDRELRPEEWRNHGQVTYAIRCEATGRVKIGTSKHPEKRLRDLQAGSASRLTLVAILDVDEFSAHDDLQEYRLHGEWFQWAPGVRVYIAGHAV